MSAKLISHVHVHVVLKVYVGTDLHVITACVCGVAELWLAALCAEQMECRGILAVALHVIISHIKICSLSEWLLLFLSTQNDSVFDEQI